MIYSLRLGLVGKWKRRKFNIIFAYQGGLLCQVEELLSSFIVALDSVIQDEENTMVQMSPEEWHAIRPSKYLRRSALLDIMNVSMSEIILISDMHHKNV